MLYVFHVDTGRMIKFDMNVALGSVQNLKDIIQRTHGIPAPNIVLLVSGGDMLAPGKLVCSYSAGTDTNPIYMFSTIDVKLQSCPSIESSNFDVDLSNQVKKCISLPANYPTVVARAQLAQQMYELAREEEQVCETLVHEQHLQQQGWSAVIANMEDLTDEFRQRFENFSHSFDEHLNQRDKHLELLESFSNDLQNLSKIPILPGLLQNAEEEFHGFDNYLDNDDVFSRSQQNESMLIQPTDGCGGASASNNNSDTYAGGIVSSSSGSGGVELKRPRLSKETTPVPELTSVSAVSDGSVGSKSDELACGSGNRKTIRNLTLLQWISAKENHNALKTMADECSQGLGTFTKEIYDKLKAEVFNIINFAQQEDIKEIKGLESRLYGLEKMMFDLKKFVQDQKELATAFQQNQNRASNLNDASIFPDLCASHREQLSHMLNHHMKIRDYRRRVSKAKDELGANLNKRLKYIVHIENTMSNLDNNLLFYHRCLRRVEKHLNIIQQIHQTPQIYVAAVTEVVRRRIFSTEFIQWASKLALDFDAIHNEEVQRRREFNSNFEGHFLNTLFPGMNDMPPAFANENPLIFDSTLPNVTKNDFEMLSNFLPDITENIQIPDMGTVIEFFISRSGKKSSNGKMATSVKSQSNIKLVTEEGVIALHRPIDFHAHLKDGFESETDTEEFEKVGQSTNEKMSVEIQEPITIKTAIEERLTVSAGIETDRVEMNTVETLTEENDDLHQLEHLKLLLKSMSQVSYQCLELFKNNLQSIKSDHENNKIDIKNQLTTLSETWTRVQNEYDTRQRVSAETLKNSHDCELSDLKNSLRAKQKELDLLKVQQANFESSHNENLIFWQTKNQKLIDQIKLFQDEISVLKLKLNENLVEKEKAINEVRDKLIHEHKTEIESLRCRFKLMTSMESSPTSDSSLEKDKMIEIGLYESILMQFREDFNNEKEQAIREALESEKSKWESCLPASTKALTDNLELLKKMIEDKDKQLEILREHDLMLTKENYELKIKFETLTNEEESDKGWLKEKIEYLSRDKSRLEQELDTEKLRRIEMETSVATIKSSAIESSMLRSKHLTKSTISTDCCNAGDIVFIVWNIRHRQFIIVQEAPTIFFVHGDSLSLLNLKLPLVGDTEIPVPFYTLARVVNKEYCQAKKEENRYKVTKGTKFYRVKLEPVTELKWHNRRERLEFLSLAGIPVSLLTNTQNVTDSGAQTESSTTAMIGVSLTPVSTVVNTKDLVDSPILREIASGSGLTAATGFKERTVSVCSITEEEDEPIALISDRSRYISVSEGEEKAVADQPSSLSTDYQIAGNSTTLRSDINRDDKNGATASSLPLIGTLNTLFPQDLNLALLDAINQQNDDSDEYRSLEGKDDQEFPVITTVTDSGISTTTITGEIVMTATPSPSEIIDNDNLSSALLK